MEVIVKLAQRLRCVKFQMAYDAYPAGHPLRGEDADGAAAAPTSAGKGGKGHQAPPTVHARRDFRLPGYVVVFCVGCCFCYCIFLVFLGPRFVTGGCRGFDLRDSAGIWVFRSYGVLLSSASASSSSVTNSSVVLALASNLSSTGSNISGVLTANPTTCVAGFFGGTG